MRGRLTFVIVLSVIAFGFAGLNWSEVARTAPLSFGPVVTDGAVGLVLLTLLAVTLIAFLISAATQETRHRIDYGRNQRTLEAQRELADKAEASRFTDLRQQLDTHLRDNRQRDTIVATEFEKAMVQSQREMRNQLEAMSQVMATQLRELESRLDSRFERLHRAGDVTSPVADVPPRDRIKL